MSYEEFVKLHGKPPPPRPSPSRTAAPGRQRTAPRIDTRFTTTVSGASRTAGSPSGSPDAERNDVTLYLANLYNAIERAWDKPGGMELSVEVDVDIAPNGRLTNVRIAKSSGNAAYDESALAAVRSVGSAGPTPGGVTLLRTLRFNMKAQ
jgi:colicin import membrane protein